MDSNGKICLWERNWRIRRISPMVVKILILDLDVVYKRLKNLHTFWNNFITFLSRVDYDLYVYLESLAYIFKDFSDFLEKVSPYLCNFGPVLQSLEEIEVEEEEEEESIREELARIHELTREERKRLCDNLDEIIINSYEDLIYDITGSDVFRECYRREIVVSIMEEMEKVKKGRNGKGQKRKI